MFSKTISFYPWGDKPMNYHRKKIVVLMASLLLLICNFPVLLPLHAAKVSKPVIPPESIPVFCYHRVIPNPKSSYDLSPEQLEAHFQYFKSNGYTPITVSQYLECLKNPALFPAKPVMLTFDDGSKSHITQVLPMLKKYGFKATFYIFTNAMNGTKSLWLSWDEVLEIQKSGMDIGSHTVFHPYLTFRDKMNSQQYSLWLDKELTQSKKVLEEKLKIKVNSLAYPFGLYDSQVEAAAIRAGYAGMLSLNMGPNGPKENPYRIKRQLMVNSTGPKSLANIFNEKILDLEIISPADAAIVETVPVIRFRVKNPAIQTIKLEVFKYQSTVKPDTQGLCTFQIPGKLRSGFQNITVRGWDAANNYYVNSWGIYFKTPEKAQ
jgi:peptidoglycan/xylan/chitin deacetylase (PgdA/CDA1 family)